MTAMVSTRISDDLKSELEDYDVNLSEVVREALEAEVRERRRQCLLEQANDAADALEEKPSTEEIVAAVRDTREEN